MKLLILIAVVIGAAAVFGASGAGKAYGIASATTSYECSGTYNESPTSQTCTISSGSNAVCVLRTNKPVMTQTCAITQAPGTSSNRAKVLQVAMVNHGPTPQKHTQIVKITQTNGAAANIAEVGQVVKQSLGPGHFDDTEESEAEPVTTMSLTPLVLQQDFHQSVEVNQTTTTGNNDSSIGQFGKQRSRAKQAPGITQKQNTLVESHCPVGVDDANANMCSVVKQTSTSGQNVSRLDDAYLQFARAHKSSSALQQQGEATGVGGLDHTIQQTSSGFCKIETRQIERQVERAVRTDGQQIQHGPTRKGSQSFQECSPSAIWRGLQDSTQTATSRPTEQDVDTLVFSTTFAEQDNLLEYIGESSGDIRATQSVKQQTNNQRETETNSCPPPGSPAGDNHFCFAVITCTNPDVDFAPSAAPTDPNRCEAVEPSED